MNKSAFLKLIKQVANISDQQTEELEKVAATFPYCQTAHLLLAKSAYDKGSMLSTQRLRKASSYATDRQLLKRIIYTSTVAEPVFNESIKEQQEEGTSLITAQTEPIQEIISDTLEDQAVPEKEADQVQEVAQDIITPSDGYESEASEDAIEETDNLEDTEVQEEQVPAAVAEEQHQLDSELAMLLTINSLSSSFTDLLAQKPDPDPIAEQVLAAENLPDHLSETGEALAELEAEKETEDQLVNSTSIVEEAEPIVTDDIYEEAPTEEITDAADAEINYSLDEIDRLYTEDALGYWMASSRMGESLQLKDDYTRQRPQSFHPELILEYSKTHELEKAVQPNQHSLSQQLDLIDQFLKLNPRLKTMANIKLKPEPQEDLSLKSTKIKRGMASESLANIFLKQGKVKKAVKIYEQLILKNPEKKSYFAEQIEKLQNLS